MYGGCWGHAAGWPLTWLEGSSCAYACGAGTRLAGADMGPQGCGACRGRFPAPGSILVNPPAARLLTRVHRHVFELRTGQQRWARGRREKEVLIWLAGNWLHPDAAARPTKQSMQARHEHAAVQRSPPPGGRMPCMLSVRTGCSNVIAKQPKHSPT